MNQVSTFKGLKGNSIVQQVGISPSKPFVDFLSINPNNLIFDVLHHHKFAELMNSDESLERVNSLVIVGADDQCLGVIEGLAVWFFRYERGDKMPRLIVIGFEDFKFPDWVNFVHQPISRIYNREIVTDMIHGWQEVLMSEISTLEDGGKIVLVTPSEEDFSIYNSNIEDILPRDSEIKVIFWPDLPEDDGEKYLYLVPGKTDSNLWIENVEVIIDVGIESHKVISPTGGEMKEFVFSDKKKIKSRSMWLGHNRRGKHVRMFDGKNVPLKNLMPAERGRIFKLVNRMKNLTPDYQKYLPLIPKERMDVASSVLEGLEIRSDFVENMNYSPQTIKIIQNRIENDKPLLGAIFLACLVDFQEDIIMWPYSEDMREGDDYEKRISNFEESIGQRLKKSSLETYFSLMADFYMDEGMSGKIRTKTTKEHEKWLKENSYVNRNIFTKFANCINYLMDILREYEYLMTYDPEIGFLDDDLIEEIQLNYKNRLLKHKIGLTYVDLKGREWLVDLRDSKNEKKPEQVYALGWKLNKYKENQMIANIWYKSEHQNDYENGDM